MVARRFVQGRKGLIYVAKMDLDDALADLPELAKNLEAQPIREMLDDAWADADELETSPITG